MGGCRRNCGLTLLFRPTCCHITIICILYALKTSEHTEYSYIISIWIRRDRIQSFFSFILRESYDLRLLLLAQSICIFLITCSVNFSYHINMWKNYAKIYILILNHLNNSTFLSKSILSLWKHNCHSHSKILHNFLFKYRFISNQTTYYSKLVVQNMLLIVGYKLRKFLQKLHDISIIFNRSCI